MPLPKRTLRGQSYTITMMELRRQPGEALDAARDGATLRITRNGKHIATLSPAHDFDWAALAGLRKLPAEY